MKNPNQKSVDAAESALDGYMAVTGTEDLDIAVTDLLTDLMHYCDATGSGLDFDNLLGRARYHYEAEINEKST